MVPAMPNPPNPHGLPDTHHSTHAPVPSARRGVRALYAAAGCASLALGVLGVFLPGLPTTPFVLLAAACFAKASPRLHAWLLAHRLFGPMVRDWETHRSLTPRTKALAVGSMSVMVAVSALWGLAGRPLAQAAVVAAGAVGAIVVLRIPTRR